VGDGRLNPDAVAGPIAVYCSNGGVAIVNIVNGQGSGGVNANGGQIATALAQAGSSRQNVQIVASGPTSLWALSSGELQAVYRGTTNYDFVFSPSRCGITFTLTGGSSVIVVTATPIGAPGALPPVYGPGTGYTPPAAPPASSGSCLVPVGARAAHVVRSGENLFRIGLRYGVDYRIIAAYNGISDPARIYVGQCIIIP
jgi:nucleoid-associated protein YgaU